MTDKEQKNGIIYVRVSSHEQIEGTSLESQERLCRDYAERENIIVMGVFIEKGESAKTTERTQFIKAINFCSIKSNKIERFIVYKVDRFARNQADHITVRQTLKKYSTELCSVTEPISDSPMGKMMEGILSTFAEFDNNVRTERSVNGMRERIKQGIWVWQAPLGYYRPTKGSNLVPDPVFASFVRMAFKEYAKGTYTFESLATFLNDRGFVSRQGNKAIPQLVEKIIKNPLYCGIIKVWDMEYKGAFEPIVSESDFYLCQGGKFTNKNGKRFKKHQDFPLRKLVKCQFCGQSLTGSNSTGRHKTKYPYYHHQTQGCEYAKFIPKETFEQMFVEYLHSINPSLEYEKAFKVIVLDIWKNNHKLYDDHNRLVRKEINALEIKQQRVFELHQSGIYSDNDFVVQKNVIAKKIAEKETLIHERRIDEFNMSEALEYCFNFVRNTAETWINLKDDFDARLRFQKLIFEENLDFSGIEFGTAKLSPIYSIYQEYLRDPSTLVSLIEMRPKDSLPCKAHFSSFWLLNRPFSRGSFLCI